MKISIRYYDNQELGEEEHFDQSVVYFWEVKKFQDTRKDKDNE